MYLSGAPLTDALPQPVLIVLSHLRWDFVFQRPQQLMTRAARDYRVIFIEEPVFEGDSPTFREMTRDHGITVIQPVLPPGTPAAEVILHQGDIADAVAARAGAAPIYL